MMSAHHPVYAVDETPAGISWPRFAGILLAGAACGLAQWYIAHGQYWSEASVLLVAGALVAAVLLGRPATDATRTEPLAPPAAFDRRGIGLAVLGAGLFVFAVYRLSWSWTRSFVVEAPLAVTGIAVWSAGLARTESPQRRRAAHLAMPGWERWLFLGIVALGFFLRFYRYGYFPPPNGFYALEESQLGQIAFEITRQHHRPWEFLGDAWLAVAGFALFGRTVTGLRIPFTIVSGLTVVALYMLLRQLVSRPAALFATALFAICRWHLIYARYAHNIYPTTLLVVILYALCVRAHRRGTLAVYPWIGFLSAYTLFTYAGYRGTSVFVGIFLVLSLVTRWRALRVAIAPQAYASARFALRKQLCGLALAGVAYIGVVIPMGVQVWKNPLGPQFYFEAAVRAIRDPAYYSPDRLELVRQITERARVTAMMFNHAGDEARTSNLPEQPMLDPISGVLFTIGLLYCVVWSRYRFQGYFAFTFLVLLIMGTIFVHNFDVRRLQGIIPLIFVLIAFVADRLYEVVGARVGARARPLLAGVALLAFGFAFRDNYDVYFRGMMNDMDVRAAFQNPYTIGIRYLHSLPANAYVLMFSDAVNFFMPSDYEWWRGNAVPGKVTADLLSLLSYQRGPWTGRDLHVFIADPFEHDEIARLLQERFPATRCTGLTDPDIPSFLRFSTCQVPPSAKPKGWQPRVRARYFRGDSAEPLLERTEPAIGYAFLPNVCRFPIAFMKPPCRAEWEGTWDTPQDGRYEVQAEARNGSVIMSVDGQPVNGAVDLTAGRHVVRVQARFHSIEATGAHVQVLRNGQWELLQLATLEPSTP